MKYLLLLPALSALVLTNLIVVADEPQKDKEGFVSLFNGKDFSGWVNMGQEAGWSIKDNVIHSAGETGGNWLRSEKQYKNFILKVEWRVSQGGNSGVFIRSAEKGLPWTTGYEVQITNAPRDDAHCTGSLYGYAAVNPRPDESHDTWHTFEIQCHNHHIRILADVNALDQITENKMPINMDLRSIESMIYLFTSLFDILNYLYKKTLDICNLQQKLSKLIKMGTGLTKRRIILATNTFVKLK